MITWQRLFPEKLVPWLVVVVLNLIFVNEIPLGWEIYVKLLCASITTGNYSQVSLCTYFTHQSSCWYPPPPPPFSPLLLVYCLFSQCSLLYNHSLTLIYRWLTGACLHYLPFLSWCTGTLQIQLNLFTIVQLLANAAQLQGWKISDITTDISSFPFIGSVRTIAEMLH